MESKVTSLLAIMLVLLLTTGLAGATSAPRPLQQGGAPQVVSYQGQVMVGGERYDGTGYFKFAVVDAVGSITYWSNNSTSIGAEEPTEAVPLPVNDGLFNVLLGDTTLSGMSAPLTDAAFEGTDRYLRVWFSETGAADTFTRLIPDRRIAAVPYALQAETARNAWALDGNSGTDPATHFLGTTDVTSLTLGVNNTAGLRLAPGRLDGNGPPNVIGGSASNVISPTKKGSVIGGGGYPGEPNRITADYATIGGGRGNEAAIHDATVGGGRGNAATADSATVGGGYNNTAGGYAATVPGGSQNLAQEDYTFAAGRRAQAVHFGAFVWADATNADFPSASEDEFAVRASGGVRLETDGAGATLDGHALLDTRGEAHIIVDVTADPVVNGQNLLAAYAEAAALTPYGQPLSTVNRAVVLLPPGQYNLVTATLALDAEYVDLEGLSADRDKQHIYGTTAVNNTGVIMQTANNVRLENLFVEITRDSGGTNKNASDPAAYFPEGDETATVIHNCHFRPAYQSHAWSMRYGVTYPGTYEQVRGYRAAFGGGGTASGTFTDCTGGYDSFGGDGGTASGTFTNCTGGDESFGGDGGVASGTFTDCTGGDESFGGAVLGEASGTFINCTGGSGAFGGYGWINMGGMFISGGGTASGTFTNCTGGEFAFGGNDPHSDNGTASGTFTNCTGGESAFGGGGGSADGGVFSYCTGGADSFSTSGSPAPVHLYCTRDGVAYPGEAHIIVDVTADPVVNGQNLLAAYAEAAALTPHGQPLSTTNRAVVLLPPGQYDLVTTTLALNAEYVDLEGLSADRDKQHIYGTTAVTNTGVISQTANDVRLENLFVEITRDSGGINYTASQPAAYFPEGDETATVIHNCHFKAAYQNHAWSMRYGVTYPGTYEQVRGYQAAFGGGGTASGTFTDCTGGDESFGGNGGTARGTFTDCTGGDESFGGAYSGMASGTFINCTGGSGAFGGYGGMEYGDGGWIIFGSGTARGTFTNCTGGGSAFGGGSGTASGTFTNCTGGGSAFGGNGSAAGGVFSYCTGGAGSFSTSGSPAPVHLYCIQDGVAYP